MSVTAVPLHPIKKGSLIKLWLALALLALVGIGVAIAQTGQQGTVTASGLRYEVIKAGTGPHPGDGDMVLVNYTGKLADGSVFDKSERPSPLPVDGLIPGFTEGLKLMQAGGKYRLHIPSALGYGPEGAGGGVIPPNADLDFDIELLKIAPGAAAAAAAMMPPPQ